MLPIGHKDFPSASVKPISEKADEVSTTSENLLDLVHARRKRSELFEDFLPAFVAAD